METLTKCSLLSWILALILSFVLFISTTQASECIEELDIAFIIDSSVSIRENNRNGIDNWKLITDFVKTTVSQIKVGSDLIRIAIIIYSSSVDVSQVLTLENGVNKDEVITRIETLDYLGESTNTAGALAYATNNIFNGNNGDRSFIRNLAIVLTDGLSNVNQENTALEALQAKSQGIDIFAIGITEYSDPAELQEIASDPLGFYYLHVDFYDELNSVIDQLLGRICISRPPPRLPCLNSKIDLAILMDESGSIIDKNPEGSGPLYNWNVMKEFVAGVIASLDVGPDLAKVSVTKFSDVSRTQFKLDLYDNKEDMIADILAFEHRSGATNISGALRVLRTEIFHESYGDRANVQNIGVLITDGESTVDEDNVAEEARLLKATGVRMFGLGITDFVDQDELRTIASDPPEDHIFQTEYIEDVNELTSVLVFGVCNEVPECTGSDCDKPGASRCNNADNFKWIHEPRHLLLGHNHARLQSVASPNICKSFCLKDPNCRSVDYIDFAHECSISYVTRVEQPMEFAESSHADYYEWICENDDYKEFYMDRIGSGDGRGGPNTKNLPPPDKKKADSGTKALTWSLYLLVTLISLCRVL